MVESQRSVLLVGLVVVGRGASWRGQPVGRCSRFNPCTPVWFDIGRLACGLFTVRSRLQLRCGLCTVVLATPWSVEFALVPSRCCRWSYSRMLFVGPALPFRCRLVAPWFVQVQCGVVGYCWLVGFVMVESWCSVVLVGMAVDRRSAACCRQPMGRCCRFDPCMPGDFGVGWLVCGLFIVGSLSCSSFISSPLCSPRRCSRTWFSLSSRFVLRVAAACLSGAVDWSRPGCARCVVLVRRRLFASGQPIWVVWWPVWARPAVSDRCSCPYVAHSSSGMLFWRCARFGDACACGCCVVRITVVGTSLSVPPNGRLVLPLDALGRGGRVGSVTVVPVARGRYSTLWWCAAPSWQGVSPGEEG